MVKGKNYFILSQEEICRILNDYLENKIWSSLWGDSKVVKVRELHEKGRSIKIYIKEEKG